MITAVLALSSALFYGLGTVLQQRGTLQTQAGERDPRFLIEMLRKPAWLLGIVGQIIGILLQAAALKTGSLVIVQSLVALSLVFALPFGARLTNQYIGRRTLLGASATILGIMAFVLIGQPQSTLDESPVLTILVTGLVAIVLMIFLAVQGRRRRGAVTAAFYSTAAGLSFALGAAVLKALTMLVGDDIPLALLVPTAIVLVISTIGGMVLAQSALKTGYLAPAMAGSNATTLIGSVLLGFIVFQESITSELHLVTLALVGLALATFGVVVLAHPETQPELSSLPHA
jgi:drug/metabolite transporter (DMT)-like permease